jgi:transaldolase
MALLLAYAQVEDAQCVAGLGFIWGATTTGASIAKSGRPPSDVIAELCELLPGTVFYQLSAPTLAEREAEALSIIEINPVQVGVAIPCKTENLSLLARLSDEGYTCGVTAVFGAYQAYLVCEAGAHFILFDVNHSTRLQGDGLELVTAIRDVIEVADTGTDLIATGLTTPAQVVETLIAGAHHLSLSLDLLLSLGEHPLSQQVSEELG